MTLQLTADARERQINPPETHNVHATISTICGAWLVVSDEYQREFRIVERSDGPRVVYLSTEWKPESYLAALRVATSLVADDFAREAGAL